MPTVAIAHSNEKHRSFERVLSLVSDALGHLGGIDAFVKPAQAVLIQPSLGADPQVVAALVHLTRNAGAGKIQVAECSPNLFSSLDHLRNDELREIAARRGAEMIDLAGERVSHREVELSEGRVLHRASLPVPLLEADVIIAVPKARTDYLDVVAGAMQMWLGIVNQHPAAVVNDEDLIGQYADIAALLRPDLCVVDALICGEGDGPAANLPHWCGCILASADPVATDVTIASLLRRDPKKLRFAAAGEERGLGRKEPIVWLGTTVDKVAFEAWPSHEGFGHLPINVLVGDGVTLFGTIGRVRSALDDLLHAGVLEEVIRNNGTPTIMIGAVDDSEFERHVQEGPYLVFDDAARPKYKTDPRVWFIAGHPVPHAAIADVTRGLRAYQLRPDRREAHDPQFGSYSYKSRSSARAGLLGALAVGVMAGIRSFARRA